MKIGIFTWYNKQISNYADNFFKINKIYCEKHGYDLIKSSKSFYKGRVDYTWKSTHWERYPLLLRHIKKYDYVMWIDADAFFYVDSPPLENLIKKYDKEILLSQDKNYDNDGDVPPWINSGVFIIKNTEKAIEILKRWAFSQKLRRFTRYRRTGWIHDQAMIRGTYNCNMNNIKDISTVIPYLELQHFIKGEEKYNSPYIYHVAGRPAIRYEESKEYLRRLLSKS